MITIVIPGNKIIEAEFLVLDFNGTLAIDGSLIKGVRELLNELSTSLQIHVITSDTFGKASEGLRDINCTLKILKGNDHQMQKLRYLETLGKQRTIAIGNGLNDTLMLENAALGIALLQKEGLSVIAMQHADILCTCILDALELLTNPGRIIATLRK